MMRVRYGAPQVQYAHSEGTWDWLQLRLSVYLYAKLDGLMLGGMGAVICYAKAGCSGKGLWESPTSLHQSKQISTPKGEFVQ